VLVPVTFHLILKSYIMGWLIQRLDMLVKLIINQYKNIKRRVHNC